ncbi:RNA-binding protein [Candidatus Woesearchaeota archaeon]|nr:RNA-binding protein [Candidatus Woesearchaeota archaeon]
MKQELHCISCKKSQTNSQGTAVFACPQCSKFQIVRCQHCREIAAPFTCPECGFVGPA